MTHITFIHGIENKPPADKLLKLWRTFLADAPDGLDLGANGVSSSMVYWADVLYEAPVALTEAPLAAGDVQPPRAPSIEEAVFTAGLAAKLGGTLAAADLAGDSDIKTERIPLPWPIKKAFLENFLRDVHHYLFDVDFSPRPGVRYHVRKEIRARFVKALKSVATGKGPHIVVSHSMGTVIAYDCLKNVSDCPAIDGLVTIGSPLGLDEIQDKLAPSYSAANGFPSERVIGGWTNIFDRLDPVDGFDPMLANDFKLDGAAKVADVEVVNHGAWRHDIQEYLQRDEVRSTLRKALRV